MQPLNFLALDVGSKRVGVAMARHDVLVPVILPALEREDNKFWENLTKIIHQNDIGHIVIGLPRGLDGQDTPQTEYVRNFTNEFKQHVKLLISMQDEALTSVKAESILKLGGKPYNKSDIDGLSASLILGDYLEEM